jgi:hypothetical protein
VAIDELEFRHGRLGRPRGDKAFSVLCAVGYGDFQRPYVAAIEAVPRADSQAWTRLPGSLEGRPAWVVGDGGHPLATAAALWARIDVNVGEDPGFRTWRCEWHLARSIIQALPDKITRDRTDRIHHLVGEAVRSASGWQRLCDELSTRSRHDGSCHGALRSMLNIRDVVRAQGGMAAHGPRSTGAVEEFFRQLDNAIGDRVSRLTNKTRTDTLLELLAARRNGWLDETAWAELIREHLANTHGRAPEQRRHVDSRTAPSLRAYPR